MVGYTAQPELSEGILCCDLQVDLGWLHCDDSWVKTHDGCDLQVDLGWLHSRYLSGSGSICCDLQVDLGWLHSPGWPPPPLVCCDLQVDLGWLHYLRDKPLIEWQVGGNKP